MGTCSKANHVGAHRLDWFSYWGGHKLKILYYVEQAVNHAYDEDDDIAEAMPIVMDVIDRAKKADHPLAWKTGLIVSDAELQAITLVVEDACEYMQCNRYDEDWSYPEDAAACAALGDGTLATFCVAE